MLHPGAVRVEYGGRLCSASAMVLRLPDGDIRVTVANTTASHMGKLRKLGNEAPAMHVRVVGLMTHHRASCRVPLIHASDLETFLRAEMRLRRSLSSQRRSGDNGV